MDKGKAPVEERWKRVQGHLGFTDKELTLFRSYPNHVKAMEEAPLFSTHQMVIEVVEAHNCAAGYRPGDRFVVDAEGCLISDQCPARLCAAAVYAFKPLIDRLWQAFYNNSTDILHDTVHCPDVGVDKGGAGSVTMRGRAIPMNSERKDRSR
jgi:uncharacterized repeat protein (TIGR04076 family)